MLNEQITVNHYITGTINIRKLIRILATSQ
jgi:hypothetical protein